MRALMHKVKCNSPATSGPVANAGDGAFHMEVAPAQDEWRKISREAPLWRRRHMRGQNNAVRNSSNTVRKGRRGGSEKQQPKNFDAAGRLQYAQPAPQPIYAFNAGDSNPAHAATRLPRP